MTRAIEVVLGLVLLGAGALKAADPVQATLAVDAYDLLSPRVAVAAGLWLPGLEIAAGAALLTGFLARGGAALAALLATTRDPVHQVRLTAVESLNRIRNR